MFKISIFFQFFKFRWKIKNRLNRKKNQICDFYFSSCGHFYTQNYPIFWWNFTHYSNNKNCISFFILFSTFRIFHKNLITSERVGSAYPYLGQGLRTIRIMCCVKVCKYIIAISPIVLRRGFLLRCAIFNFLSRCAGKDLYVWPIHTYPPICVACVCVCMCVLTYQLHISLCVYVYVCV